MKEANPRPGLDPPRELLRIDDQCRRVAHHSDAAAGRIGA